MRSMPLRVDFLFSMSGHWSRQMIFACCNFMGLLHGQESVLVNKKSARTICLANKSENASQNYAFLTQQRANHQSSSPGK